MYLTLFTTFTLLCPLALARSITVRNTKSWPTCFKVELSSGSFPMNNVCAGHPGFAGK